jgi:hypothetical protein
MNEALLASAYETARENFKAAALATFRSLDSAFAGEDFDTIHQASRRGIQLHLATMDLALKIHAGMVSYEKAEDILRNQFPEFSDSTRREALGESHKESR